MVEEIFKYWIQNERKWERKKQKRFSKSNPAWGLCKPPKEGLKTFSLNFSTMLETQFFSSCCTKKRLILQKLPESCRWKHPEARVSNELTSCAASIPWVIGNFLLLLVWPSVFGDLVNWRRCVGEVVGENWVPPTSRSLETFVWRESAPEWTRVISAAKAFNNFVSIVFQQFCVNSFGIGISAALVQTVHYCKCMVRITRKLTLVITYFSTQKMAHSNIKWLHNKPLKELLIEN